MTGIRSKLTYANVMATIAVFLALGGGAYALQHNSVGTKEIRTGGVKSSDIGNGQVKSVDIGNGEVRPADAAASLGLSCPVLTFYHQGACVETAERPSDSFANAQNTCTQNNRRLPTLAELQLIRLRPGIDFADFEWSSERAAFFTAPNNGGARIISVADDGAISADDTSAGARHYRCVGPATG